MSHVAAQHPFHGSDVPSSHPARPCLASPDVHILKISYPANSLLARLITALNCGASPAEPRGRATKKLDRIIVDAVALRRAGIRGLTLEPTCLFTIRLRCRHQTIASGGGHDASEHGSQHYSEHRDRLEARSGSASPSAPTTALVMPFGETSSASKPRFAPQEMTDSPVHQHLRGRSSRPWTNSS
jgi:hypothetical protein